MAKNLKFVSLDRIIAKIYRDLGLDDVSEIDVIEWTGEALEGIGSLSYLEEAVAFVEIENHKGKLPNGLNSIIQIARNNMWVKENKSCTPANILLDCDDEEIIECNKRGGDCTGKSKGELPILLDCQGHIIGDYEVAYYRPYFDLQYEYHGWSKSNYYTEHFSPVRLSDHSFFNSLVCHEDNREGLYNTVVDEYTIQHDEIMTSFKEGQVAIAYVRSVIDKNTGYPMIPDEYSTIAAITAYITMKYMARLWYQGREGYGDKYRKAEESWQWYCRQASNGNFMPHGIDEFQNLHDSLKSGLLPTAPNYYSYFGKMSRPKDESWKDTKRTFRGI